MGMRHVNAPAFQETCCIFHGTAIYVSFALGRLLSTSCKPLWTPIATEESEVCANCGLLVSKHTTCSWCAHGATTRVDDGGVSDHSFEKSKINKEHLTNCCINVLRHIGPADLTTAIEYLLGTAVNMSTDPKWQDFWEKTCPPCNDWTCAVCDAKNDEVSGQQCLICGKLNE